MQLRVLSIILFTLLFIVSESFQASAQQIKKSNEPRCSQEMWSIIYTPISFLGLSDAPAKIISTSVGWNKDDWMTGVELNNLSGKTITAAEFQWYLFRENSREKILTRGETTILDTQELTPEEKRYVEWTFPCKKIYKALAENGSSEDKLVIEFAVSELSYKDGSKWERK